MPSTESIRRIRVQQISEGGAELRTDLAATTRAANDVGNAVTGLAVTTETASSRALSAGPRFRQLGMQLDVTAKASAALERGLRNANLYLAQNGDQAGAVATQIARLNTVYEETLRKSAGLTAAQRSQAQAAIEAAAAQEQAAVAFQRALNARLGVGGSGGGGDREADFMAAAEAADRQKAKYDAVFAAQQRYAVAQREITELQRAGVISQGTYNASLAEATTAYDQQIAKLNGVISAQERADRAAHSLRQGMAGLSEIGRTQLGNIDASRRLGSLGNTAQPEANLNNRLRADQVQNLLYQGGDIFSSLGSGMSPTTTLLQQGPQIAQVFGGPGGASIKGAFSQAGEAAAGLAARVGIVGGALGALVTASIAAVAAQQSFSSTQTDLTRQLSGVGRASGVTAGQINEIASASATAGGVSTRQFRDMAGTFAATGRIGVGILADLGKITKDYAATTGQDLPEATKALAEAFANPAEGADALNKQLGFLTDTSREAIQRLDAQGNRLGAQRMLFDAYKSSLSSATELTSAWGRATASVGVVISNIWDGIGQAVDRVVTGGDLETQLATAQKVLENSRSRAGGLLGTILPGLAGSDVTKALDEVKRVQDQIDQRARRSADAQQARLSTRIGDIVRGLDPAGEALKKIEDSATKIRENLAKLPLDEQGAARRAMDGLLAQAKQLREDMAAGGAAFADRLRDAQFQQRTVGFTPQGMSVAQINENAGSLTQETLRQGGSEQDIFARLQSLEVERVTRLQTMNQQTALNENQVGGAFSRMTAAVQQQILSASQSERYGNIPAGIIAAIAERESSGKLGVGFTRERNPDGSVGSAFGLGQITRGTAADAVRRGFLPPGFDRMNESTMAEGIAGVLQMKLKDAGGDLTKALNNYGTGAGYGADILRRAGQMGDPSTAAQVRAQDEQTRAVRDNVQALDNAKRYYGENGLALDAAGEAQRRYNQLLDAGVPASTALAASIQELATKSATAAQQMRMVQFGRDVAFDREQLGRTDAEASAFARARSMIGDTSSPAAQFIIQQQQLNDNLRTTRDLARDSFGSIVTDLSHGTSLANCFASAVGRISDKLISLGTDKLISGLFGNGSNGGSGFLSGILGGGGSGGSSGGGLGSTFSFFTGGFNPIPSFANGGIMTSGGPIPLRAYAGGGIANSPQLALYGEGRRPEAYVPLPDGKRIPVAMAGPSNTNSTTVRGGDSYFDLRGSSLTEAQVRAALAQAISANNAEVARILPALMDEARYNGALVR